MMVPSVVTIIFVILTLTNCSQLVTFDATSDMANLVSSLLKSVGQGLKNTLHCLTDGSTSVSDKFIGQLLADRENYCPFECLRALPGVLCCTPQMPDELGVKFLFYSSNNDINTLAIDLNWEQVNTMTPPVGRDSKLVMLVHGFTENAHISPWMDRVRRSYQGQGWDVVVVDWSFGAELLTYWQSVANVRTVGAMMGQLAIAWNVVDRSRLVGFSLGGQIIGEAGRHVQRMLNGQKLASCHGLDPAGPFFTGCVRTQLQPSDCDLVEVIHTSAEPIKNLGLAILSLGSRTKSGHCDYWINCGYTQPLCQVSRHLMSTVRQLLLTTIFFESID